MYTKRGQATILILLGIVIVSIVGGVYYSRDYIFKSKMERLSERSLVVPKQAESVKEYVMSCVRQVTEEAVDLAGQQGGYITFPGDPIPPSVYNKFSNSLEILPGLRVPYWYYKSANNVDKYQILNLEQISNNIAKYVDENLRICVGTFGGFKNQDYKINPGMIKSDVEIQNEKVLFNVNFPLRMEIKGFKFDFKQFYYKVDKPLGELYDIARGIYNYENGKLVFEDKTIDMMVAYEDIPLTGESFDCGFTPIWDKFVVIENFKKALSYNIPVFKIKGTDYILSEDEERYYSIDVGSVSKDVDVNFVYSGSWPFKLDVTPEDNGILKSTSISSGVAGKLKSVIESVFCYTNWHFVYNVKYPVLVVLSKDDYIFQYAMMVVIDKNEARENPVEPLSLPELDVRFCDNKLFDIDVSVYDEYGKAVNDVDVSYKCINHICDLGKTEGNFFEGRVMACSGGSVLANKEGYHYGSAQVDTFDDISVSVDMKKLKEFNVDIEVLRGGAGEMREDEILYLSLENDEDDYSVSVVYPNNKKIKLITGNYKVSMFLSKESDDITIPGKEVEHCVDVPKRSFTGIFGQTEKKCVSVKIPSVELDRVIVGAAEFNMKVSKVDLARNNIRFFVPYQGIPQSYDDLSKLSTGVGGNFVYPRFN